MKKLERALSLVLTVVMLLGMFMVPTGAVSNFTDARLIENTEAVQITSGIGLFAGTTDGKFAPKATVTRAQMATIIVKMLRGSNFNADAFKGVDKFPDTASFEGGWAEGYINACVQLGVVAGYGDGTFKPGRELTTAEAMTMIINALGIDPGEGEWPVNYMAKAEALKLYGDMAVKPSADKPLNRDQLAVIVWEGLQYSPDGKSGYQIPGSDLVFTDISDAILANGNSFEGITEAVGTDSLASKVYEIKVSTGWITANQAAGEDCTVLTLADGSEEYYNVETDIDMLGHYVTVYYKEQFKNDEEPGEVYTVVDESTVVTVKETIDTAKAYKAAFGKNVDEAQNGLLLSGDYTVTEKLSDNMTNAIDGYTAGSAAPKGTYIIADGVIVAYIAPVTTYASYISNIDAISGQEKIYINGVPVSNAEGDDMVVEYAGMAIGDFVTYVKVGDVYVLSPVKKVTGAVTKTSTTEINGENYDAITLDSTLYPAFEPQGTNPSNNMARKLDNKLSNMQYGQNYTLYITEENHYIGFETAGGTVSMDNTVFLLGTLPAPVKEKDQYGKITFVNKVRGIDMDGKEVMLDIGKSVDVNGDGIYQIGEDVEALGSMDSVTRGYYTYELSTDKDEKKENIQILNAYAGAYSPENPTYVIMAKSTSGTFSGSGSIATSDSIPAYGTSRMKFFAVDGDVSDSAPLTVSTPSGVQINSNNNNYYVLVTRAGNGSNEIEAFIYMTDDKIGQTVYFRATQEQAETPAYSVDGTSYTVYSADTGKEMEIVLDPESDAVLTSAGMYYGKKDSEGLFYEIKAVATSSPVKATFSDNIPQVASDVGFWGLNNNYLRGERMASDAGGAINMMMNGWTNSASSAAVVDLRSDEEIEASGVPAITSLNQMVQLRESDPGLVIVYDAYLTDNSSGSAGVVETVFVTAAYSRTVGLNSIVYASASPKSGDTVIAVRSETADLGEEVEVTFDVTENAGPGFYRFGVIAGGKLALLAFDSDVLPSGTYGNFGMTAMHNALNTVEVAGAGTLNLSTSDISHPGCGFKCNAPSVEARTDVTVNKDTLVLDMDGSVIDIAALAAMHSSNDLVINYYCDTPVYSSGAADLANRDTTAEMVVIVDKAPIESSCNGDHTGWSAVTGSSITESGNYYLTGDMTQPLTISADNVTLCLDGHSIRVPTTTTGSAVVVSGNHLNLVTCEPRITSRLVGVNAPAVAGSYTIGSVDSSRILCASMVYCAEHGWHDDGSWQPFTGTRLTDGNYYLAGDTVASGAITVSGNVTLCLGNATLTAPATNVTNFIVVEGGATLTIRADDDGTIQGQGDSGITATRGIQVKQRGTLNLKSGTITGFANNSSYGGAGVCVDVGTFVMEGGTITGNETTNSTASFLGGGGVTVTNGGKFTMKGGTISDNQVIATNGKAVGGGGGVSVGGGTFTMEGGTIEKNSADCANTNYGGGGVFVADVTLSGTVYQGTFTMTSGSIQNNTATTSKNCGGGVLVTGGGVFTMDEGTIDKNQAKQGGGISGYGNAAVTIMGGTISNNVAVNTANGGGGLCLISPGASLSISGGKITGNSAKYNNAAQNYGAIFVGGDVPVEIHGGEIYGNSSKTYGVRINGANSGKNSKITGGTIQETISVNKTAMCDITGGTFKQDPSTLGTIPGTHAVTDNGDGTFTVTQK